MLTGDWIGVATVGVMVGAAWLDGRRQNRKIAVVSQERQEEMHVENRERLLIIETTLGAKLDPLWNWWIRQQKSK